MTKMTDIKCSIQKPVLNHYLCQGLSQDFLVDSVTAWEPHPVNLDFRNLGVVDSTYIVIAESTRAPIIAVHQ